MTGGGQLNLFDDFPPYASGSDTSLEAAESVEHLTGRLRMEIYAAIKGRESSGATCDEIEVSFDLRHQTASARIYELHTKNFIIDSGARRLTRSGRNAVVWVVPRAVAP